MLGLVEVHVEKSGLETFAENIKGYSEDELHRLRDQLIRDKRSKLMHVDMEQRLRTVFTPEPLASLDPTLTARLEECADALGQLGLDIESLDARIGLVDELIAKCGGLTEAEREARRILEEVGPDMDQAVKEMGLEGEEATDFKVAFVGRFVVSGLHVFLTAGAHDLHETLREAGGIAVGMVLRGEAA